MKQFGRILRWSVVGLCVGFIVIQFVPVNRTNPPVEGDSSCSRGSAFGFAARMLRLSFERDRVAVVFARSAAVLGHCP